MPPPEYLREMLDDGPPEFTTKQVVLFSIVAIVFSPIIMIGLVAVALYDRLHR